MFVLSSKLANGLLL